MARPVANQGTAQAQANLALAEADLQRTKDLVAKGFISQAKLDEVARNFENARSVVASARAQASANDRTGAEYQLVLARVAQSEASLKVAQARLANLAIVAPVDALVLARASEPGDIAQAGKTIMTLAQAGETRVYATVDEKNLRYLQVGFPGRALADAFPNSPFPVELYYVAPGVDAQRGTVEIRLRVPDPPSFIRPDMTVSVEMIVAKKDAAFIAPAEAIRGADTKTPYVLAVRDAHAVNVPVTIGLRGVGTVEIESGVAEAEELILPQSDVIPGDRVRTKPRKAAAGGGQIIPGLGGR